MLKMKPYDTLMDELGHLLVDPVLAKEDYDKLTSGYYGVSCHPLMHKRCCLFLGVASGIEILLMTTVNPEVVIHLVETNLQAADKLRALSLPGVTVFTSFDDYLAMPSPQYYDHVRITRRHFSLTLIQQLYAKHTLVSVCGEVDEKCCPLLSLYRASRENCDYFFFRVKDHVHPLAGRRKKPGQPEVSVVVAAYGVENYIDECINSLVNQTLNDIEIIIVDDGSVDYTGKKADEWQRRFRRKIQVIHKENGGCASARQVGLEAATGEYVTFVDGDDWVEAPMYEALFESAVLHNSDIAQCGFYQFFGDQTRKYHPTAEGADGQHGTRGLVKDPVSYLTIMPSIWRRIYKADFLKRYQINFPVQIRRHDDLPFGFIALARAQRISVIPDCYYAYRLNRPGQDVGITDIRLYIHFEIFEWLYAQVRPWASMAVMHQLRLVEYASHYWVLNQLDEELKARYLHRALSGTQLRYGMYNVKDDWVAKLNAAASTEKTKQ